MYHPSICDENLVGRPLAALGPMMSLMLVKHTFFVLQELSGNVSKCLRDRFSSLKVKKWANDDLDKTLTWLESQEEKVHSSAFNSS